MGEDAPLAGLRVLELASGVAGPYAGRLLAMLGATVVKVERPGGDPARTKPVDDEPLTGTSPLYLHLNAGKLNASSATIDGGRWDAVIDDRVRAELDGTELDPAGRPDGPLLVSVTPFGFAADAGGGAVAGAAVVAPVDGSGHRDVPHPSLPRRSTEATQQRPSRAPTSRASSPQGPQRATGPGATRPE